MESVERVEMLFEGGGRERVSIEGESNVEV